MDQPKDVKQESDSPEAEADRRDFLAHAGKLAFTIPPAMMLLLSTTMSSPAIAQSVTPPGPPPPPGPV